MNPEEATQESSTDAEQFRERIDELVKGEVNAETAEHVADLYPDHVVATPECIEGMLAEELRAVSEFVQTEEVLQVNRETDCGGAPRKVSVVLGGENPNTGPIRETIQRGSLWFTSAGVHEGRLHVRFCATDPEEVDRC